MLNPYGFSALSRSRNRCHPARSRRIQNVGKSMDSATPLRYAQKDKGSFSESAEIGVIGGLILTCFFL
jgi:hypothetical protein